ncbi:MAG TPA: PaaI family thioesterase [Chitinophaga sp.]|uniref:PaaI family thioesterase n=1 Tax=Chitinophaga sp. TaxID=1869181 RepID=UPI002C69352D|nr:PaaI family thioesterase [Chitinophaga sp.]HVI45713.1 PaaI family thioesterase [Chitinophaga sp.]
MKKPDPQIEKRIRDSFARQKLMAAYGAEITDIGHGYMEISVAPQDFLLRTSGIFHGGVLAAMADTAAGYAAGTIHTNDASFLTVEFKISFLNPAQGNRLVTRARLLKGGRTLTIAQADLYSIDEDLEKQVATAIVTLIKAN